MAKTIISPALGSQPIGKIKAHQLDALYAGLVKARGLSPSSVRQEHAVIRSSLNQAVKWGWLSTNPAVKASPPAVRRSEIVDEAGMVATSKLAELIRLANQRA